MFGQIQEMTKMTVKILLRNKFFLFFAILLPLAATLLLNISNMSASKEEEGSITVLNHLNTQMAYLEDAQKFQVKVYNSTDSTNFQELLETLGSNSLFQFFEVKSASYKEEEIMDSAKYTAMHDKVDAIVWVKPNFDKEIEQGEVTDSIVLFQAGEDARYEIFEKAIDTRLMECISKEKAKQIDSSGELTKDDWSKKVELEQLEATKDVSLLEMDVDAEKTSIFGNALAVYTAAFVFSGILILGTILFERENLVYTRVLLSKANEYSYILAKFMVVIVTALIETLVATISYELLVKQEVGLSLGQFALILFGMALIFNSLSVGVGIFCGNTLSACLASFSVWMLSALLGGLYFDITDAAESYKRIATLMPQRWGVKAASLFMNGNAQGYPLIFVVTITYVIVILLIGVFGLRFTHKK